MALCMQTRSIAGVRPAARSAVRSAPFRGSRVVVRASPAVSDIVDKLKTLTLLEASELVSEIERTFGVDASAAAPAAMSAAPVAAAAAPVVEEKTTFDVVLEAIPADKKVGVYKVVRNIAGIAVNQVKEFTATLPKVLKEAMSKEDAEAAKAQLVEVGATAKVV
ncbi:50S ribosomal protein L12, chloroplastic [Tetrabaena socialis]|uniref:50S ribosomal protein L12, chloroplastic n=1 Tax=Tetrabaena socialis TaxID=47790 RepID=A0A2J7ZZQ4_9CHLO|nr:50S ribosomal protein L12, chloroplastic [Tetrabaena socialis]|eukprot:PNH05749.1 50S ribosomal protein L12, chloroplastic [Tetrabaena socialis]